LITQKPKLTAPFIYNCLVSFQRRHVRLILSDNVHLINSCIIIISNIHAENHDFSRMMSRTNMTQVEFQHNVLCYRTTLMGIWHGEYHFKQLMQCKTLRGKWTARHNYDSTFLMYVFTNKDSSWLIFCFDSMPKTKTTYSTQLNEHLRTQE